jgi:hypothetical protein
MININEVKKLGYTVLPEGGWLVIDPLLIPHDWDKLSERWGFDPNAKEVVLCVFGFKEVHEESKE